MHARADLVDLASRAGPVATRALQERVRSLQKQFLHTRAMQVEQTRVRLAFATKQETGVRWAFSGDECARSAVASKGQVLRPNRKQRSKGSQRDWSSAASPMKNAAQFALRGAFMFCWREGGIRIVAEKPLLIDNYLQGFFLIPPRIPLRCPPCGEGKRREGKGRSISFDPGLTRAAHIPSICISAWLSVAQEPLATCVLNL